MLDPDKCKSMAELRVGIDALDVELMKMLALRARFIDRAAELKPAENLPARTVDRVEQVAQNARRNAQNYGFDPDLAERMWRDMIEWAIAHEDRLMGTGPETDLRPKTE